MYCGGYTCVFKMDLVCGISVDINSCYPAVMQDAMPVIHESSEVEEESISSHMQGIKVDYKNAMLLISDHNFYRVTYRVNSSITSAISKTADMLSLIEKREHTNVWMTGCMFRNVMKETLHSDDDSFCRSDRVIKFKGMDIYRHYIKTFYTKRLEVKRRGDVVKDTLYKILLNSLYGKHAQKPMMVQKMFDNFEDMFDYLNTMKNRQDFGKIQLRFVQDKEHSEVDDNHIQNLFKQMKRLPRHYCVEAEQIEGK